MTMRAKTNRSAFGYWLVRRYSGLLQAALLTLASLASLAANAQTTLVVGFAPGGRADIIARSLAAEMNAATGDLVMVQNQPGAAQATAMAGAQSGDVRRDGRTLYVLIGGMSSMPAEFSSRFRDFTPVALIGQSSEQGWIGVFAPPGTAAAVAGRAQSIVTSAAQSARVRSALDMAKMSGSGGDAAQLAALVASAPSSSPSAAQPAPAQAEVFGGGAKSSAGGAKSSPKTAAPDSAGQVFGGGARGR